LIFKPDIQFRALEPLLKSSAYPADARVIWSSSLESSPAFYKDADWQLMNTKHSYEAAKYQIDLIGTVLDRRALQDSSSTKRIRHFVSHPGVCSTKFSNNLVAFGGFLDTLKVIVFYLVRQTKLCCA
jgi:3-keto steroid reductase